MKKVYSHDDRFMVWQVKQLLDEKGIPCFIKNEFAIGAIGELSPLDALPEVWVSEDSWLPKAEQYVAEFQIQPPHSEPWVCNSCQEKNGPSFELCWQCGADSAEQH